jgi:hypothetical protein
MSSRILGFVIVECLNAFKVQVVAWLWETDEARTLGQFTRFVISTSRLVGKRSNIKKFTPPRRNSRHAHEPLQVHTHSFTIQHASPSPHRRSAEKYARSRKLHLRCSTNTPVRLRRCRCRPRRMPRPWLPLESHWKLHGCKVQSKHVPARAETREDTAEQGDSQREAAED